jgi:hypothetical protein
MTDEYLKIVTDESFSKCIAIRSTPEYASDYHKQLLKYYNIPIPPTPQQTWVFNDVRPIVLRLRQIAEDIDFQEDEYGRHTADAIRFYALLEALAGKRYAYKLAYLVLQCNI